MDDQDSLEYDFKDLDYERIMDLALDYFKKDAIRFGDRTSLCKSYIKAMLVFTKSNNLVLVDGTIRKLSAKTRSQS